jgi:hypothetical protein
VQPLVPDTAPNHDLRHQRKTSKERKAMSWEGQAQRIMTSSKGIWLLSWDP